MSVTKNDMFEAWCGQTLLGDKNSSVFKFVLRKLNLNNDRRDNQYNMVARKINNFNSAVAAMWKNCKRSRRVFEARHREWLNESIIFIEELNEAVPGLSRGRPEKLFKDLGDQRKRQKLMPLLDNYSTEQLTFATRKSLESLGQRNASNIIKEITENSPTRATKIKKAMNKKEILPVKYSADEALTLFLDCSLTKNGYILLQQGAKEHNAQIYPNYNILLEAKKKCYPSENDIRITDISAEVSLQALVDHTVKRIIESQQDLYNNLPQNISKNDITIRYKWGCDGSAGHSHYKQKFSGQHEESNSDLNLFSVCLVPLQMASNSGTIVWQNPRPSSTRFCRPIKLVFQKETPGLCRNEIKNIEDQISEIKPTVIDEYQLTISHKFKMTMIDGKMFSVISNSSTQTCGICGASPKIMNNLKMLKTLPINQSLYDYGISTLHAWIRCLECCLHISYRLDLKKWQIRDENDKQIVKERKNHIIKRLKQDLSLLVDIPKQGYGTTNDGNTARRFFQNHSQTALITGLDEAFLKHLFIILSTMSSGYEINKKAFAEYCKSTAILYIELYSWYYMPASLHRILIHGPEVIKAVPLPIGMFSEEALESRNKDFRKYRESFSRKFSREETMKDVFCRLLVSSDPLISSLSKCIGTRSNKQPLNKDVLKLLQEPHLSNEMYENENASDSENSDQ